MRKLLVIIPFFMLLCGAQAFAADEPVLFPLDMGRIWSYDDASADRIVSLVKVENTSTVLQAYVFENYNFSRRVFYRDGNKIYEWKEGYRRLWYDFGATAKATWKMTWEAVAVKPVAAGTDTRPPMPAEMKDINDGAVMTLVEKDVVMKVPYGEFNGCVHFNITRPGFADAAYVDEWFAPGVGCIQRTRDTIAGARTNQLVKIYVPEPPSPLRMEVSLDKETYKAGEDIKITVSVKNGSDKPVTQKFTSGLQMDYFIDGSYVYSKNHASTTVLTDVTIPAGEFKQWPFTHTAKDFAVPPGKHIVTAYMVGTKVTASRGFIVNYNLTALPAGVILAVKTDKESYSMGEPILFTLTATNKTTAEVTLAINVMTVKYAINDMVFSQDNIEIMAPVKELKIGAGQSVTFDMKHTADIRTLSPGSYTLYAGLRGYDGMASAKFTVTSQYSLGIVSGIVYGYTPEQSASPVAFVPLQGAVIKLTAVMPKSYDAQLSSLPTTDKTEFSATSDEKGLFTITGVPVGVFYTVTVVKDKYYTYNETIRTLTKETQLKPVLKPVQIITEKDFNYKIHNLLGLSIYIGTDQTVYKPDSQVRATFRVTNTLKDAVTFTFANDNYVDWYLELQNEQPIKILPVVQSEGGSVGGTKKALDVVPAPLPITLQAGESRSFVRQVVLKGQVKETGGKYSIRASLRYATCSVTGLKPGDVSDYITVLVVASPVVSQRIDANGHSNEMVIDMKSTQQASVNIVTRNTDVSGQILVTEIMDNLHKPLDNKRFVKMVEVDADADIRDNMENATIRIYFKPEDLSSPAAVEKLVIAHWDDKADNPKWEILESRVDTVNNFVVATTSSFSSFGLFESAVPTAVGEAEVPLVFKLEQNVPNPFNPSTTIQFQLPAAGHVQLSVYNMVGQEVVRLVDGALPAGVHRVVFNGSRFGSGIYFYRVTGNGISATRKMLLIK
ncbi:MAG: BsuPI-related putative proteinase inhibitor [Candidatus Latescibacter sp.]|nr:BsuPI-related putative proteinase inhibitor [Candidatus Latescibacter sp.]